jgi:hypothetical protein
MVGQLFPQIVAVHPGLAAQRTIGDMPPPPLVGGCGAPRGPF